MHSNIKQYSSYVNNINSQSNSRPYLNFFQQSDFIPLKINSVVTLFCDATKWNYSVLVIINGKVFIKHSQFIIQTLNWIAKASYHLFKQNLKNLFDTEELVTYSKCDCNQARKIVTLTIIAKQNLFHWQPAKKKEHKRWKQSGEENKNCSTLSRHSSTN